MPNDPALKGAIDMHAHQDPDSFGPSYGQAARSIDALDLYTRAKAAGMRGFIIKGHLDQTAGLAYYMRKLHPEFEIFGGMGSNLTTGTKQQISIWFRDRYMFVLSVRDDYLQPRALLRAALEIKP